MTSSTVARDRDPAPAPVAAPLPDLDAVDALVGEMRAALKAEQRADGHWPFELEADATIPRSEEHTSELQSLMRLSSAVFRLKKKNELQPYNTHISQTY